MTSIWLIIKKFISIKLLSTVGFIKNNKNLGFFN